MPNNTVIKPTLGQPVKERQITYAQAVRECLYQCMERDANVFLMGLGATDPKGVFQTMTGLKEKFGENRIFDMPVSENAMTGIAVGTAFMGMRPVMVHQRGDFVLMAMDQIINNAAKWHYMYGGKMKVPLTIRTIIGRGWGQGPQHSQNFQGLFAQIPGLKVVAPTTPYEAKGLLASSIEENNPVIFVEHRWLHNQLGTVPEDYYCLPIGTARTMRIGHDVTVVANMDMVLEALQAAKRLESQGVSVEVINLCSIKPFDENLILRSVEKTGRLLIVDSSWMSFGISSEIAATVIEKGFDLLKSKIIRLGLPDVPTPTSPALSKHYYPRADDICLAISKLVQQEFHASKTEEVENDVPHDVPDEKFKGPF